MARQLSHDREQFAEMAEMLSDWLTEQRHQPGSVVVEKITPATYGVSNETFLLEVREIDERGDESVTKQVLRMTPSTRGVLEPYDISRQFRVMRALRGSRVLVPEMLELDESGDVLGRPCFTMQYLDGTTLQPPNYVLDVDDDAKRRMSISALEMMTNVHQVDWKARGLDFLTDEGDWVDAEIARWETRHVNLGMDWPPLDELLAWLKANRPVSTIRTLVHGDVKLSNYMWQGEDIVALLDWEMAGIGDPLMDLAYYLAMPTVNPQGSYLFAEGLSRDETIARYEELTGFPVTNLGWYEALNFYKLAVILAICLDMFAEGQTDDLRYFAAGSSAGRMIALGAAAAGYSTNDVIDVPMPEMVRLVSASAAALEHVVLPVLTGDSETTQVKAAIQALAVVLDQVRAS